MISVETIMDIMIDPDSGREVSEEERQEFALRVLRVMKAVADLGELCVVNAEFSCEFAGIDGNIKPGDRLGVTISTGDDE